MLLFYQLFTAILFLSLFTYMIINTLEHKEAIEATIPGGVTFPVPFIVIVAFLIVTVLFAFAASIAAIGCLVLAL